MEQKTQIPWYKNPFIVSFIGTIFCLMTLMSQCSTGNKVTTVQRQNAELIKAVEENTKAVNQFNEIVKIQIDQNFTQNLLYTDQLNRKQISTQDVINKLEVLNKKLNEQKNR